MSSFNTQSNNTSIDAHNHSAFAWLTCDVIKKFVSLVSLEDVKITPMIPSSVVSSSYGAGVSMVMKKAHRRSLTVDSYSVVKQAKMCYSPTQMVDQCHEVDDKAIALLNFVVDCMPMTVAQDGCESDSSPSRSRGHSRTQSWSDAFCRLDDAAYATTESDDDSVCSSWSPRSSFSSVNDEDLSEKHVGVKQSGPTVSELIDMQMMAHFGYFDNLGEDWTAFDFAGVIDEFNGRSRFQIIDEDMEDVSDADSVCSSCSSHSSFSSSHSEQDVCEQDDQVKPMDPTVDSKIEIHLLRDVVCFGKPVDETVILLLPVIEDVVNPVTETSCEAVVVCPSFSSVNGEDVCEKRTGVKQSAPVVVERMDLHMMAHLGYFDDVGDDWATFDFVGAVNAFNGRNIVNSNH
ncbi:hypothetical protein HDU85_001432 [Gaertneriomyces sp. JEL0708]|nr:hypothetical protein HDU85_001432 [Gaertneriomyces sp. JEL0708]